MRIDEVINEVEFGSVAQGMQNIKTGAQRFAGKISRGAAKAAIQGDVKAQAMKGANSISTAYTKWLAVSHPNENPVILNIELFKDFMATSAKLKPQLTDPEFLELIPDLKFKGAISASWKNSSEADRAKIADKGQISSIYLALAQSQIQTTNTGSSTPKGMPGATDDPQVLAKVDNATSNMSKDVQIATFNSLAKKLGKA